MQINLFSSGQNTYAKEAQRILSRQFETTFDLDALLQCNCTDEHFVRTVNAAKEEMEYLQSLRAKKITCSSEIRYETISRTARGDKMHTLELLGIGNYAKQYTIFFDFKNELAFFLHMLSGCSTEQIKSIPDYYDLSRSLLTYNKERLEEFDLSCIFGLDPNLDEYLVTLLGRISTDLNCSLLKTDDVTAEFAYKFYIELMNEVAHVRDYTALEFCTLKKNELNTIYRSKGFADAICTADRPFTEPVEICNVGEHGITESLVIIPECYEKCQYAFKEEPDAFIRYGNFR